jgi:hypothetical protein
MWGLETQNKHYHIVDLLICFQKFKGALSLHPMQGSLIFVNTKITIFSWLIQEYLVCL